MDLSALDGALDGGVTKPRVLEGYTSVEDVWDDLDDENVKKKHIGDRIVEKGKLEITRECNECGKKIKKAKKALQCKCKVVLFCTHEWFGRVRPLRFLYQADGSGKNRSREFQISQEHYFETKLYWQRDSWVNVQDDGWHKQID